MFLMNINRDIARSIRKEGCKPLRTVPEMPNKFLAIDVGGHQTLQTYQGTGDRIESP